jgi:hypothetical protein
LFASRPAGFSRASAALLSTASPILLRTPFQEQREPEKTPLRARLVEGVAYLWSRPFLRTCALLYGLGNPLIIGILLVLALVGRRQGLTGGEVTIFAACALSLFSWGWLSQAIRSAPSLDELVEITRSSAAADPQPSAR